jgi:hypothetical protein
MAFQKAEQIKIKLFNLSCNIVIPKLTLLLKHINIL